ncbi:MAG: hypothetical protein AB2812_03975 [Candidatus Sedimenticola endophacoides]
MSSPTTPPSAESSLPGTDPLQALRGDALLAPLLERLAAAPNGRRLEACEAAIGHLRQRLWADGLQPGLLPAYQALHRQREALLATRGGEPRHSFIIVIPVADRPRQLHACLDSLFELCRRFGYGGHDGSRFTRVEALVADDSGETQSIRANREICAAFTRRGLHTEHFDQQRQQAELQRLSATQRTQLARIIGEHPPDAFFHKGASIMRNITYLRLWRLCAERQRPILYFIDSDQTFRIKARSHGANSHYALNHLHHLDRLFSRGDTLVLTGKVVGDPPVSPAVMAGNSLDDTTRFLEEVRHTATPARPAPSTPIPSGPTPPPTTTWPTCSVSGRPPPPSATSATSGSDTTTAAAWNASRSGSTASSTARTRPAPATTTPTPGPWTAPGCKRHAPSIPETTPSNPKPCAFSSPSPHSACAWPGRSWAV